MSDESSAKTPAVDTVATDQTTARDARATGPRRAGRPRRYSPEVRAAAIARYLDGEKPVDIAKDVGCDAETMYRWTQEERAVEKAVERAADKRLLPAMLHLRARLLQRQIDVVGSTTGEEASRMLERLDARIAAVLSATARPTPGSDTVAAGDVDKLVEQFLSRTASAPQGVVPS